MVVSPANMSSFYTPDSHQTRSSACHFPVALWPVCVGALHPAFDTPDGHYATIRHMADVLVNVALAGEPQLLSSPLAHPLLRELIATCVLRPVVMLFAPATANRVSTHTRMWLMHAVKSAVSSKHLSWQLCVCSSPSI